MMKRKRVIVDMRIELPDEYDAWQCLNCNNSFVIKSKEKVQYCPACSNTSLRDTRLEHLPKPKPKLCPFCGKQPTLEPVHPEVEGDAWGRVRCTNPKCSVQPQVSDGLDICDDRGSDEYIRSAIVRWNHRG